MTTLGIQYLTYMETARSNLANEDIKNRTLDETRRANQAQEGIRLQELSETRRHNKATEGEARRHNQQQEYLTNWYNTQSIGIAQQKADSEVSLNKKKELDIVYQSYLDTKKVDETHRHNVATEGQTEFSNWSAAIVGKGGLLGNLTTGLSSLGKLLK